MYKNAHHSSFDNKVGKRPMSIHKGLGNKCGGALSGSQEGERGRSVVTDMEDSSVESLRKGDSHMHNISPFLSES